jgi:hypothetical protein
MNNLESAFNRALLSLRKFEESINFSTSQNDNSEIKDFNSFKRIIESTLLAVPAMATLMKKTKNKDLTCQDFLIKSSIAYNLRFYDSLIEEMQKSPLFPWEAMLDKERDLFVILLWKQNLFSMITVYLLALESLEYQAMQILRGYIESTAILYLSLLDLEFLNKYTSGIDSEEYMKLWFKELKPSKVKEKINNIHKTWDKDDAEKGIKSFRLPGYIITSTFVENVYNQTSNYIHFNKQALLSNAISIQDNRIYIGVLKGTDKSQFEVFNIMANLFPLLSNLLEIAIRCHIPVKYNKTMRDFSMLNIELYSEVIKE